MVKDYKNKTLQATVSYFKDTNNIVYRLNTVNWVPMGITMHNTRSRTRLLCINMPRLTIQQRVWICVDMLESIMRKKFYVDGVIIGMMFLLRE